MMAYLRERNVPTEVVPPEDHDPFPLVRPLYGVWMNTDRLGWVRAVAEMEQARATYNDGTCRTCFASRCVCRHLV